MFIFQLREQVGDLVDGVVRQASENVFEIFPRLDTMQLSGADQGVDQRRALGALVRTGK
jgi:hypothetical protein